MEASESDPGPSDVAALEETRSDPVDAAPEPADDVAEDVPEDTAEKEEDETTSVDKGACQNWEDIGLAGGDTYYAALTKCTSGCEGKPADCPGPCVHSYAGLTEACAACHGGLIGCALQWCGGACKADFASNECASCIEENGCLGTFWECSGW